MTASQEEYLKNIYILVKQNGYARVTDIAENMRISKPSVNRAIKKLKKDNLVDFEIYGDIYLTGQGEKIAKEIIKRHETLKAFLIEVLKVDRKKAEKEADLMKHAVSKDTVEKLEKYIQGIIDVEGLTCNYNPKSKKCRDCVKIKSKKVV